MTPQDEQGLPEPSPIGSMPLLERERELEVLDDVARAAAAGTGGLVVLEGSAGLGKTALLSRGLQNGLSSRSEALRARGGELEQEFPFGVVLQLFEPVLAAASPEEREALLDGAASLAAPIFDPARATGGDPELFSLVHGLYWLSSNLAERGPLVIAIDDVHWIDVPSLRFLLYLGQRLEDSPIALVATMRPEEHRLAPELLVQLAAHSAASVLRLAPLTMEASAQLVRWMLEDADDAFCDACFEVTAGNPFLLKELLSELKIEGVEPSAASAPRIGSLAPGAVSRSVLIRLLRLPDRAATLARAVAVLGDGAALRHAAELGGLDLDMASGAADALSASDVFEPGEPLRFAHPLVRSAVYSDIPAAERSAAHLRAARLLGAHGEPPARVAAQLLAARPAGDPWVVDALRAAAAEASARGACDSAAQLLRRALEEPPSADQRAHVLRALGEAEAAGGHGEAFGHLREAANLTADPTERSAIRFVLGRRLLLSGRFAEAAETFDRGLSEDDGGDPELTTQLEAGYISAARLDVSLRTRALERLERLLERPSAGSSGIERLLLGTLAFERAVKGEPCDTVIPVARRALEAGMLMNEHSGDSAGFGGAVVALGWTDELDGAEAALTRAIERAREVGSILHFAHASMFRAFVYYRQGRLRDAVADASAALDHSTLASEAGGPGPNGVLAQALMERGDLEGARDALDVPEVEERWSGTAPFAYFLEARGRLRLSTGDPERALEDFLACGELLSGLRAPNPAMVAWRSWAARASERLGDHGRARALAEEELVLARRFGAPRAIAIALRAVGALEGGKAALERLHEAAALLEASPARLERARTLVDLGAALRRENQRAAARSPLEGGLELARACGATALVDRATDELAAAGGRAARSALGGVESLTPSERRVADMAAAGLTNREIAQRLFVTIKAVQWHLGNTYRKLHISSREELPAALDGEGAAVEQAAGD